MGNTKYTSVDQALNAIDFGSMPEDWNQGDIKNAVRPVLASLYQGNVPEAARDLCVSAFVEKTLPTLISTFVKHSQSRAA